MAAECILPREQTWRSNIAKSPRCGPSSRGRLELSIFVKGRDYFYSRCQLFSFSFLSFSIKIRVQMKSWNEDVGLFQGDFQELSDNLRTILIYRYCLLWVLETYLFVEVGVSLKKFLLLVPAFKYSFYKKKF